MLLGLLIWAYAGAITSSRQIERRCREDVDATTGVRQRVFTGGNPNSLALTSDGGRLSVGLAGGGGVAVVDPATERVLDTFGIADPATLPQIAQVDISDNAPPPAQPGQRFAPNPQNTTCVF